MILVWLVVASEDGLPIALVHQVQKLQVIFHHSEEETIKTKKRCISFFFVLLPFPFPPSLCDNRAPLSSSPSSCRMQFCTWKREEEEEKKQDASPLTK